MASNRRTRDFERSNLAKEPDTQDLESFLSIQSEERSEAFAKGLDEAESLEFFTVKKFAEMAQISTQTVKRWIRMGKIRAQKLGWRWLIHRSEFEVSLCPGGHNNLFRVQEDTYHAFFEEIAPSLLRRLRSLSVYSWQGKSRNYHFVFFDRASSKEFGIFDQESFRSLKKWLETFTSDEIMYVFRATARDEE
jgi:excisionase family DNA binding protein